MALLPWNLFRFQANFNAFLYCHPPKHDCVQLLFKKAKGSHCNQEQTEAKTTTKKRTSGNMLKTMNLFEKIDKM